MSLIVARDVWKSYTTGVVELPAIQGVSLSGDRAMIPNGTEHESAEFFVWWMQSRTGETICLRSAAIYGRRSRT